MLSPFGAPRGGCLFGLAEGLSYANLCLQVMFSAENSHLRTYWVDPSDMRTAMHQAAFPGEDISDRDLPDASVPGLIELILGDLPSGRYQAKRIVEYQTPMVNGS